MIGQHRTGFLEPALAPLSRNEQFSQLSGQVQGIQSITALRINADQAQIRPRHLKTDPLQEGKYGLWPGLAEKGPQALRRI